MGVALECASRRIPLANFVKLAGVAERFDSPDAVPAKRLIIKAAHDLMICCGDEATAPAFHLQLLSEMPKWSSHAEDVCRTVVQTCATVQTLEKRAFEDVLSGAGALGRTIGYTGMAGGAGLGALYWMLSRHATQDEADIEGKKQQAQYYDRLNRDLQDSMRRKYRYSGDARPTNA